MQRPSLNNPAIAQQQDFVAEETCLAHVMRHQGDRFLQSPEDVAQIVLQVIPHQRIQGSHRFVQQHQWWIEHQSPHDPQPLPLTSGKLTGKPCQHLAGQPNKIGKLFHALLESTDHSAIQVSCASRLTLSKADRCGNRPPS